MKTRHPLLAAALALVSLGATSSLHAESTYGYAADGTSAARPTASANVQVNVTVPRMILLRVGTIGAAVDSVSISVVPNAPVGPTDGSNQAFAWNGTAPAFTATTTGPGLDAYAWTNSSGGASLNGTISIGDTGTTGLSATDIEVAAAAMGALPQLAHPGANTGSFTAVNFGRNQVYAATWNYSLRAGAAATAAAGDFNQQITYTATSL